MIRSRILPFTTTAFALGLTLLGEPGRAHGQPAEEANVVRALLVIDTDAKNIGPRLVKDQRMMARVLEEGFKDYKGRLDLKVFTGKDVDGDKIVKFYDDLPIDPSATLLFYYTGHGATDPKRGHYLATSHGPDLLRSTLLTAMRKKRPRAVVLLTDCCSPYRETTYARRDVKLTPEWETMRCLLLRHRGVVDLNAATEGELAWVASYGSVFTLPIAELFCKKVAELDTNQDGFVHWQEAFPKLQAQAQEDYVRFRKGLQAAGQSDDELEKQTSMTPQAHALPPAWRFGARVLPAKGVGVQIAELWDDTPAAVAGLKAGDVILQMGNQEVESVQDFTKALAAAKDTLRVRYRRSADNLSATVTLPPWKGMPAVID